MSTDKCRPVVVDGEVIRVRGGEPMGTAGEAFFAEIVRAAKRKHATKHPEPPVEGKQGKPTTRSSAPWATQTSSTTGRAPVAGSSNTREGKVDGEGREMRPSPAVDTRDTSEPRACPDCEQGKCRNCTGEAWDNDADAPTACPCSLNLAGPHHRKATP